jgi:hypothetical protein
MEKFVEHRCSTRRHSQQDTIVDRPRTGLAALRTRDISVGGMFVLTDECEFALDTPVFVTFSMAASKHFGDFGIEAMVVRRTAVGVGLMFLNMAADTVRILQKALDSESKAKTKPPIALAFA